MNHFKNWNFSILIICLLITFISCKKDPSKVGLEIQPIDSEMDLNFDDSTIHLNAFTVKRDSMNTTNILYFVLGSMNDPNFGLTRTAFNTNFRLETNKPTFGNQPVADSICLMLSYAGSWGDSAAFITANVYELLDSLSISDESEYDARSEINYDPVAVGSKTFTPNLTDSVVINEVKYPPFLSIKLSQEFAERMLADSLNFGTNEDFLKVFHGLRVEAQQTSETGNIVYFKPTSTETKLVLYYSSDTIHSSFSFVVNDNCTWFNNYYQEYTNPDLQFEEEGGQQDSISALNHLYLQPFLGTRIRLDFTGFDELRKKENVALNEVKLILPNALDYNASMAPPARFIIYALDGDQEVLILDAMTSAYFDGNYKQDLNQYSIRMTRYFQQRLQNEVMDDDILYLQIIGGAYNANSVVLKGNLDASIRLYYTEY
ncbi:MAG: DUF4270 family protein [Bacteroidales bacterium]|nr:DUF4270 family protein [Bacteroidales bacterium]